MFVLPLFLYLHYVENHCWHRRECYICLLWCRNIDPIHGLVYSHTSSFLAEWSEEPIAPSNSNNVNILRLIYQGRFLHGNVTLGGKCISLGSNQYGIWIYIIWDPNLIFTVPARMWLFLLTHWGRDKMAVILQTTFWNAFSWMKMNAFSWMKMYEIRSKFHWSVFLRVQMTIFQNWFR